MKNGLFEVGSLFYILNLASRSCEALPFQCRLGVCLGENDSINSRPSGHGESVKRCVFPIHCQEVDLSPCGCKGKETSIPAGSQKPPTPNVC